MMVGDDSSHSYPAVKQTSTPTSSVNLLSRNITPFLQYFLRYSLLSSSMDTPLSLTHPLTRAGDQLGQQDLDDFFSRMPSRPTPHPPPPCTAL